MVIESQNMLLKYVLSLAPTFSLAPTWPPTFCMLETPLYLSPDGANRIHDSIHPIPTHYTLFTTLKG